MFQIFKKQFMGLNDWCRYVALGIGQPEFVSQILTFTR